MSRSVTICRAAALLQEFADHGTERRVKRPTARTPPDPLQLQKSLFGSMKNNEAIIKSLFGSMKKQ
jgi:hypothetical protein